MFRPFMFPNFEDQRREFDQLQRQFNQVLRRLDSGNRYQAAPSYPPMNVWTNEDGAVVTAELPGISAEDLEISVVQDTVTIGGARKADELPENGTYHRRERRFGKFNRSFQMPFQVEADKVSATFKHGVLQLSLPRAEAEKPRKIAVQVA